MHLELMTYSTSASLTPNTISGGGGGDCFWEGKSPWWYGWSKHSWKTGWIWCHNLSNLRRYDVSPSFLRWYNMSPFFLMILNRPYCLSSSFFDSHLVLMLVASRSTRSPGLYLMGGQTFQSWNHFMSYEAILRADLMICWVDFISSTNSFAARFLSLPFYVNLDQGCCP